MLYGQPEEEGKEEIVLCSKDEDCEADEFCSSYGCIALECPTGFSVMNHSYGKEVKQPPKIIEQIVGSGEEQQTAATGEEETPATEAEKNGFFQRIIWWIKALFS